MAGSFLVRGGRSCTRLVSGVAAPGAVVTTLPTLAADPARSPVVLEDPSLYTSLSSLTIEHELEWASLTSDTKYLDERSAANIGINARCSF